MPFIADTVFDNGLGTLTTNGDRIDITSTGEPTTYSLATTNGANSLGNSATTTGAAQDGVTDGRRVVVAAVTAGSVTTTGTAVAWALTDGTSVLYATGTVTSQSVTSGNTFTLTAISITIRDAA